jgi:penicillin amidase
MKIGATPREVAIAGRRPRLGRTTGGVIEIHGRDDLELAAGLGFAHVHDRLVQMELVRLIAQGRLCECLADEPANLEIDVFMRRLGLAHDADADAARLTPEAHALAEAYCHGVNAALRALRRPLELVLVGHRPEPWSARDVLLTVQVMSYVGLAQSQQDLEKLLAQALHAGVDAARLRELFAPHLDGVDAELLELLGRVRIEEGLLPPSVRFLSGLPRLVASNNWALGPSRSASGAALQCNDPHLEVNRLPSIWYEMVGHLPDGDYRLGITMPGLPSLAMGRTRALSFGFTYGFMDTSDFFVEEVRGGRTREAGGWADLVRRTERVRRKKAEVRDVAVFETARGVLESAPGADTVEDGLYLSRAWANRITGAAPTLDALTRLLRARTVAEGAEAARDVTVSCNWLLADRDGQIAYQQSGPLPRRSHSGLHPVPAWRADLQWQGLHATRELSGAGDPGDGVLVTANDDQDRPGRPRAITVSMGPYRADRVKALLAQRERHTLEQAVAIQRDLYSLQAERFMAVLRPLLPGSPAAAVLRDWDLRYDAGSRGATLFEECYAVLLREVFGRGLLGEEAWDHLLRETLVLTDYFHVFDRVLLEGGPEWFGGHGREALLRRVLGQVLEGRSAEGVRAWGEGRRVNMANVFFQGRLPRWLGYDHGPIPLEGGRATVAQGGLFRAHGRTTTFAPSWRYGTDLGRDEALTVLAGGPSGRRWSRLYLTDVADWLAGRYKTLRAGRAGA